MKNYTHMSSRDRKRLFVFLDQGLSIRAISERLNRHRSTIYRELSKNQDKETECYLPGIADQLRLRRCRHGRPKKIIAGNTLYFYLLRKLKSGWSPEQISGRLRLGAKPLSLGGGYKASDEWSATGTCERSRDISPRPTRRESPCLSWERVSTIHLRG